MHANFQASCFTGVGGKWGVKYSRDVTPDTLYKISNSSLASLGINHNLEDIFIEMHSFYRIKHQKQDSGRLFFTMNAPEYQNLFSGVSLLS